MRCYRTCGIALWYRTNVGKDRANIAESACIGIAVSRDPGEMLPSIAFAGAEPHPLAHEHVCSHRTHIKPIAPASHPDRIHIAPRSQPHRAWIAPASRKYRTSCLQRHRNVATQSQCVHRSYKQQTTNYACLHRAQLMHDSTTSHWPHKMPSHFIIAIRHRVNVGKDRARIALDACLGIALCAPCQTHVWPRMRE